MVGASRTWTSRGRAAVERPEPALRPSSSAISATAGGPCGIARIETGRSTPSYDAVLRLVRLCGLDLDVMLVKRDPADWRQAQDMLARTIDQRAAFLEGFVAQVRDLQAQAGVTMHRSS